MLCPKINELPNPPTDKTGWPWTQESPQLPSVMPDDKAWPKISIVTPSLNQGQFIEETIRSILLQGYPSLEYIIIDGGSTDGSLEIIKKYEPWLTYWISESDRGQSHAINKGFKRSTGDIVAWLNSDDIYFPEVLAYVANCFSESDLSRFWLVTGVEYYNYDSDVSLVRYQEPFRSLSDWIPGDAQLHQQGAFWSRSIQQHAGPLMESMHFGFDKEFFVRLLILGYRFECSSEIVGARFCNHKDCKTRKDFAKDAPVFQYEWAQLSLKHLQQDLPNHHKIKRELYKTMAYFRIRFSQDITKSYLSRVNDLLAAVYYSPSVVFRQDFLGSLLRVLVPKYESLRNRQLGK